MRAFLPWIGLLLLVSGCASPPEEGLSAARQALEQATAAEGSVYAQPEYQEAQAKLAEAQAEIARQEAEWPFSRDFSRAEQLLEEARAAGSAAVEKAGVEKERVGQEAQAALSEADSTLESARAILQKAPRRGKGAAADLQALESDLDAAQNRLDRAHRSFEEGNYPAAVEGARAASASANQVTEQIPGKR